MFTRTVRIGALPVGVVLTGSMVAVLSSQAALGGHASPTSAELSARPDQGIVLVHGEGSARTTPPKALEYDLRHFAEQYGRDYQDVLAEHRAIGRFSSLITRLEAQMPDSYVRAGLSEVGDAGDYWIQLTQRPSERLLEELRSLPVDVEVEYGAPASSLELATLAAALTRSVAERRGIVRSSSTAYNPETHVVTLEYTPVDGVSTSKADEVVRGAIASAAGRFEHDRLPVEVALERRVNAPPSVTEVTVQGGRRLRRQGGGFECTAGFTARRNGRRGVLTARHCANQVRYQRSRRVLGRARQTSYRAVDVQWYPTRRRHETNRQFRATGRGRGDDRTVHRVRNAPDGSAICHWGEGSGYDCTYVTRLDECLTIDGRRKCGVDFTRDDVSTGGDSGGPWFLGRTARGIHLGAQHGDRSYYTRISRVYQHLSARVLQR